MTLLLLIFTELVCIIPFEIDIYVLLVVNVAQVLRTQRMPHPCLAGEPFVLGYILYF